MDTSSLHSSSDQSGQKNSDNLSKTQDKLSEEQAFTSERQEPSGDASVVDPTGEPSESGLPAFDLAFTGEDISAGEEGEEEEEDAGDYEEPLAAMPSIPDVTNEDLTVEVSSSPAFVSLDQLHREGKITGTEVSYLKAKYQELHRALIGSKEKEHSLMSKVKRYTSTLESQRQQLETADTFPENVNTSDTAKMREQLLRATNQMAEIEERRYELEYRLENLTEERNIIKREYERLPKAGEYEKRMKEIQASCEELKREIQQKQSEIKSLREDVDKAQAGLVGYDKRIEEASGQVDNLKGDLLGVSGLPSQYAKEGEKIARKKAEVELEIRERDHQIADQKAEQAKLEQQRLAIEKERSNVERDIEEKKAQIDVKQTEISTVTSSLEQAKDKEQQLSVDRAALDMNLKHMNAERRDEHREHNKRVRAKEDDLRRLKRAEGMVKASRDALDSTKVLAERMTAQSEFEKNAFFEHDFANSRHRLEKDVGELKTLISQKDTVTALEQVKISQCLQDESRLQQQQNELRIEVIELVRLAAIKTEEREQKSRDYLRADQRNRRTLEDLRVKDMSITDHKKRLDELSTRLRDFARMYDVIKNERNKYMNLIQIAHQKIAEMTERTKILQNEIEILRNGVQQEESKVKAERMKVANLVVERDVLRKELSKQRFLLSEGKMQHEQQSLENNRLNQLINRSEELMVQFRKNYELAVQAKNERSVQLVEREEEVCVLAEKVQIQEGLLRKAEMELQSRDDELTMLRRKVATEVRERDLLRKQFPISKKLADEVTALQIQVEMCQDRALELEKLVQDPQFEGGTRVNILQSAPYNPLVLQEKLESLETTLAEKERQLLERELVLEQEARLVERAETRVKANSTDTLKLAKEVNSTQHHIKRHTNRLAATLAELAMRQATARKLETELRVKEQQLQVAHERLEAGEAPSEQVAHEWEVKQRVEAMRSDEREAQRAQREQEELRKMPDGSLTTAEPRPNAYIPEDERELPIPRPYGAHAPFKPQPGGSNMRHIRKPVSKPIEI